MTFLTCVLFDMRALLPSLTVNHLVKYRGLASTIQADHENTTHAALPEPRPQRGEQIAHLDEDLRFSSMDEGLQ